MMCELKALPSIVSFRGEDRELSSLSEKESDSFTRSVCRSIGQKLSDYYSLNQEEWKAFVKTINEPNDDDS